jgi:hypothetical protein
VNIFNYTFSDDELSNIDKLSSTDERLRLLVRLVSVVLQELKVASAGSYDGKMKTRVLFRMQAHHFWCCQFGMHIDYNLEGVLRHRPLEKWRSCR